MVLFLLAVFITKIYTYVNLKEGDILTVGDGWGDTFTGKYLGKTKSGELRIEKDNTVYNIESKYILR